MITRQTIKYSSVCARNIRMDKSFPIVLPVSHVGGMTRYQELNWTSPISNNFPWMIALCLEFYSKDSPWMNATFGRIQGESLDRTCTSVLDEQTIVYPFISNDFSLLYFDNRFYPMYHQKERNEGILLYR